MPNSPARQIPALANTIATVELRIHLRISMTSWGLSSPCRKSIASAPGNIRRPSQFELDLVATAADADELSLITD